MRPSIEDGGLAYVTSAQDDIDPFGRMPGKSLDTAKPLDGQAINNGRAQCDVPEAAAEIAAHRRYRRATFGASRPLKPRAAFPTCNPTHNSRIPLTLSVAGSRRVL